MEADQNQEVPAAETQAAEMESPAHEQPACDEVAEPASQPEFETKEPATKAPEPEAMKEAPGAELTQVEVSSETPAKKLEAGVADGAQEEPSGKTPEGEVEPEKQLEGTDKPEQKVEATADSAATPTEAAKEAEPAAKALEAELEKPSEAEEVKAEIPKEAALQPKEAELPLFFGWFLLSEVEEKIKCSTMEFLKTLDTMEAFKKHLSEFTGEAEKEVDLEQYFQTKTPLHCTSKFCDYGKAEGSKEYAEQQVVKDACDGASELAVVGLMVTPRTFGARVLLTPEQLQLWPPGVDKEGVPASALPSIEALPTGSRAHVTLGCAAGVEAVQTGLDLLEVLALKQAEHQPAAEAELDAGTLSYLGEGRWYLELQEAIVCDATFSSFSEDERPTGPAKKESGEKKKKPKCSIL
ncbi:2',3'-cyclic-nucleotide 3'-phosphodiesterase [Electrophorus electricus]|uniref:Cyclic nucleotide phosphodiesterase catalytic domain-containing protein n=1 Tax=Electrophorus electricus TaxID=8005 RepID=A0AAY5EPM0_ELEEL|nr:2',3'-cyclic-nucleotide 3'-phosphodiesterase [Electrophorus electricus]XP_035381989.1 2',3'-cyclic-nucleotide 3'-phosphodiesterase [Electrophorus electricus]